MKQLQKSVNRLKKQSTKQLEERGCMNGHDKIYVEYGPLRDLLEFYDNSKEAAIAVMKSRTLLSNVYFGLSTDEEYRNMGRETE